MYIDLFKLREGYKDPDIIAISTVKHVDLEMSYAEKTPASSSKPWTEHPEEEDSLTNPKFTGRTDWIMSVQ